MLIKIKICIYYYNMNRFVTAIKRRFFKELPMPVGRWRIEECTAKLDHKIDWSNEDHCGPCGQYRLDKNASPSDKRVAVRLQKYF
jgi:hypothetical protein